MANMESIFFISGDNALYSKNKHGTNSMQKELTHTIKVDGVYKGVNESSLMTKGINLDNIKKLANEYGQESILEITKNNQGILHYTNGEKVGESLLLGHAVTTTQRPPIYTTAFTDLKNGEFLLIG